MMRRIKKGSIGLAACVCLMLSLALTSFAGGWKQSNEGWQHFGEWWYQNDDGSYKRGGWSQIDGKWYYFDGDGWLLTDAWIQGTYYVGEDGAMVYNAQTKDGFYVDGDGKYIEDSWNWIDGEYEFSHAELTYWGTGIKHYGPEFAKKGERINVMRNTDDIIRVNFLGGRRNGQTIRYRTSYGSNGHFYDYSNMNEIYDAFKFRDGNLIFFVHSGDSESDEYDYVFKKR